MLILASRIDLNRVGGIEMVNRLILDALRLSQSEPVVVSLWDTSAETRRAAGSRSFGASGSRTRFLLAALRRSRQAHRSIVLATHVGLAPVGRLVKLASGGRLFVFLHGVEAWKPLPRSTRWGLRGCDQLVTNSNFTLTEFKKANPEFIQLPGDVCYLPARSLPAPAHLPEPIGQRVLVVGRLWGRGMRKGQRQVIAVWPRIVAEVPDAQFWIVGGGEGRAELEHLAKEHGVIDSVRFTGEISDCQLSELYASSGVYAMPSEGEGFGLVFAEAMAHGLPCIASRFDAGSEVVRDGETGYVVDPQNPEELFDRLRSLLTSEELRRRMSQAARTRAREVFQLDRFQRDIVRILNGS